MAYKVHQPNLTEPNVSSFLAADINVSGLLTSVRETANFQAFRIQFLDDSLDNH